MCIRDSKDAVGQVHHLVQLQTDPQHGRTLIALGHDLTVDVFNCTNVQTAGGLDLSLIPISYR